jgi:uncharacterized membrane protein
MTITKTGMSIASAAIFFASTVAGAAELPPGASGAAVGAADTVHCYGVNSCKGSADCATASHECKGHNECKGQGFKAMAAKACFAKGGTIADVK